MAGRDDQTSEESEGDDRLFGHVHRGKLRQVKVARVTDAVARRHWEAALTPGTSRSAPQPCLARDPDREQAIAEVIASTPTPSTLPGAPLDRLNTPGA